MSDRDAGDEAPLDDPLWDAFPPQAFTRVAEALDLPEDPETLVYLRNLLVPEFRFFVESCPGEWFSREERIARLKELRGALVTLDRALGPGGAKYHLPRRFWGSDLISDQFISSIRILTVEAVTQIQRLRASRGKEGRWRKDAARQLGKDLLRVYQTIMRKGAEEVDLDSFYRFAAAACKCLQTAVPQVETQLFQSPRQLRAEIRQIWLLSNKQNEKPLSL